MGGHACEKKGALNKRDQEADQNPPVIPRNATLITLAGIEAQSNEDDSQNGNDGRTNRRAHSLEG